MDKIRILHISDLHYDQSNEDMQKIIESFFDDIIKQGEIDIIIFSGDLVQKGDKNLFSEVKENFINPLLEKLNLTKNDFFIVPGNHETNREKTSDYEFELKKNFNDEKLRKIFNFSDDGLFLKKLEDFNNFKKELNQESIVFNDIFSMHKKEIKGKKVVISCLNSSLFCRKTDDEIDEGNLILSEHQIGKTIEGIEENDIKICVFHHGLNCLKLEDRTSVEKILYKNYDLLLTGHFHEETIEETLMNGQYLVKGIVGSLYGEKSKSEYSIITLAGEEIKINYRCYYPERKKYDIDSKLFEEGEYITKRNLSPSERTIINCDMIEWTEEKASKKLLSNSTSCDAPKKIEEIFVEPIFSLKNEKEILIEETKSTETKKENKKIFLKEIFASDENCIFIGEKESGKTTLINYMMLKFLKNNIEDKIIPIYFTGEEFSTSANFINEIKKYLISAGVEEIIYKKVEKLLSEGRFVFFIDDFDIEQESSLEKLNDKIKNNLKNRFLVFLKNNYGLTSFKIEENLKKLTFKKKILYMKPFNKKQIKELALKWKKKEEIENKKIIELEKNIENMGISKTPHILSLMLLVTETKTNFSPENKALLLDIFFDIVLEKMNVNDMFSSVNYTTKINYLSRIAKYMKEENKKEFLRSELEAKTLNYLKNLKLNIQRISDFVDQFIQRGIFYEENNKISFKYESFYEFFIAKQMVESDEFRESIFNKETYFCTPEEIEYYSGLRNENSYSLKQILNYIKELVQIDKKYIEDYQFNIENLKIPSKDIIEKIETTQSNCDEVIEKDSDYEKKPRYSKECLEKDRYKVSFGEKYIITLKLLSNVFRNSYLVEDKALREEAFNEIILNYSYLLIKIDEKFKEKWSKEQEVKSFFRLFFCLLISEFMVDNLLSERIMLFLREKMLNENNKVEDFITNILYLNGFYKDSLEIIDSYVGKESNFLFLNVVKMDLLKYYYLNKCSEEEIRHLKDILKKIMLKEELDNRHKILEKKNIESKVSQKINSIINLNKKLEIEKEG